jgi:hypothetical protein
MNRTISRINLPGQGEVKLPIPSLMTQINQEALEQVLTNLTKVDTEEEDFKQENNMIPVDQLKDGSLGVAITSLGLVIKKIYNQMYNYKTRQTKGTQTMTVDALREAQRKVRETDPSQTCATFSGNKRTDYNMKKVLMPSRKILQSKLIDVTKMEFNRTFNHGFYTDREGSHEVNRHKMPRLDRSVQ